MRTLRRAICVVACVVALCLGLAGHANGGPAFNGHIDNDTTDYGYYAVLTGGKFVNGQTQNSPGKDGVVCFTHDEDPHPWGSYPGAFQQWQRDVGVWSDGTAGVALAMKHQGTTVFDNNGIEDGSYPTNFFGDPNNPTQTPPGLYCGYCMCNNLDWVFAGYFKLDAEVQVDEIVGYFAETFWEPIKLDAGLRFNMNIYSTVNGTGPDAGYVIPVNTGAFRGDVFSDDNAPGTFSVTDTGEKRYFYGFPGNEDRIYRLTYELDSPITLPAGEYFFSHDAEVPPIPEPAAAVVWLLGGAVLLCCAAMRRHNRRFKTT